MNTRSKERILFIDLIERAMIRCYYIFLLSIGALIMNAQNQPLIQYNQVAHQFSIANVEDPFTAPGAKNKAYWSYFWEFGDGHYSESSNPSYCYERDGDYPVRVQLTPYYSYDPSIIIKNDLNIRQDQCVQERDYEGLNGLVDIHSNTEGELIPNNETRLVIRYSMPPPSDFGYMLFLYNSAEERKRSKLNFFPIQFVNNDVNAQNQLELKQEFSRTTAPDVMASIRPLLSDYSFHIIPCRGEPSSEGRIFLSVMASKSLDTTIIEGKKGILQSSLKAIWLPGNYGYTPEQQLSTHLLRILSVHDPNRLRIVEPRGSAYFNRKAPSNLEYKVEFQNKGGRPVRQVDIVLPWQKNLEANSIKIIDRDPSLKDCSNCPSDFDPKIDSTLSCFNVDTGGLARTGRIKFTFYNVFIHGQREKGIGGGKYTRGSVNYSVKSNRKMVQRSHQNADIIFMGGDTFTTRTDSKAWRHRGLGLRVGLNFGHSVNGFEARNSPLYNQFQAGVFYRNSPTYNGLGYGFEAKVSRFEFDYLTRVQQFADGEPTSVLLAKESISMLDLDLLFQIEARLFSVISAGIGGGFSMPLVGQGELRYNNLGYKDLAENEYQYLFEPEKISESLFDDLLERPSQSLQLIESGFGLFSKSPARDLRDRDISNTKGFGGILQWFVEIGMLNNLALGLNQEFRIYSSSYNGQCLEFNNFSVYLRLKLSTL